MGRKIETVYIWLLLIVAITLIRAQDTGSYSKQNKDLFDLIAELQASNSILITRVYASEKTNSKLQQQINELENQNEEFFDAINGLWASKMTLSERLDFAENNITQLQHIINDLESTNPVGFTFSADSDQTLVNGETVRFENERTNLGNHYNQSTSKFHCPYNGIYLFNLNVMSKQGKRMEAYIMKDNVQLVRAKADDEPTDNASSHGSAFVITECAVGQMIWVRAHTMVYLQGGFASHFSGYMLERY